MKLLVKRISVIATAFLLTTSFLQSCTQTYSPVPEAQYTQGTIYARGESGPRDFEEAVKWYRKAAEQGHNKAQFALGLMYKHGEGVPQDYVLSYMWLEISAVNGERNAEKTRDKLAKQMTPADISRAQSMARECIKSNYKNCR